MRLLLKALQSQGFRCLWKAGDTFTAAGRRAFRILEMHGPPKGDSDAGLVCEPVPYAESRNELSIR
jgi:hypothetical protein